MDYNEDGLIDKYEHAEYWGYEDANSDDNMYWVEQYDSNDDGMFDLADMYAYFA